MKYDPKRLVSLVDQCRQICVVSRLLCCVPYCLIFISANINIFPFYDKILIQKVCFQHVIGCNSYEPQLASNLFIC